MSTLTPYRRRQLAVALALLEDAARQVAWALEEDRSDVDRVYRCLLAARWSGVAYPHLRLAHRHYAKATGREPLL